MGTVHLTSNDLAATLPADYTFTAGDAGTHTFTPGATLITTGSRTLTATDTSNAAINGSQTVTVGPGAATHYVVSGLANPSTAGVAQSVTITAKDAFNNTATGYTGTVHFTSSDGAATLPANYAFMAADAGSHSFSVTLRTLSSQDVTATDTPNASITGLQTVTVHPGAATHFSVSAPASAAAGVPLSVTVTAKDSSNNTATGYTGTVHFTKSDSGAGSAVPANYTFAAGDAGAHTFPNGVTFVTVGSQSLTATDTVTSSITGSASTTVTPGTRDALRGGCTCLGHGRLGVLELGDCARPVQQHGHRLQRHAALQLERRAGGASGELNADVGRGHLQHHAEDGRLADADGDRHGQRDDHRHVEHDHCELGCGDSLRG